MVGSAAARWIEPLVGWAAAALLLDRVLRVAHHAATGWSDLGPALWGWFDPLGGRIAWDSGLYLRVAEAGYRPEEGLVAGFPGYALAIRAIDSLGVSPQTAAVLVSALSGLATTLLFWRWMLDRGLDLRTRRTALALLLTFPYAFLLAGVAYSDPLFVALVLGTVVLAESGHWVWAGLVAGAATGTRAMGLALVAYLVVLALDRSGGLTVPDPDPASGVAGRMRAGWSTLRGVRCSGRGLRPAHLGVLLSVWGIAAYAVYLWRLTGDPVAFWSAQVSGGYGHGGVLDLRTWLKASFVRSPGLEVHHIGDVLNELAATAAFALVVFAGVRVGRRFGWALSALLWSSAVMAWAFCRWLAPAGRYLLPVLPFVWAWLAAGPLATRSRARVAVPVAFLAGSVLLAAGFAGVYELHW